MLVSYFFKHLFLLPGIKKPDYLLNGLTSNHSKLFTEHYLYVDHIFFICMTNFFYSQSNADVFTLYQQAAIKNG